MVKEELGISLMADCGSTKMEVLTFSALCSLCLPSAVLLQDHPRPGGTPGA